MILESIKQLISLDNIHWGNYAFSRDPLNGKVKEEQRVTMIENANTCGIEQGRKLRAQYGNSSIKEIANHLGLNIKYEDSDGTDSYITFAKFNYPNNITIFEGNIKKANAFIEENQLEELLGEVDISEMLLAHEIFHYIEEQEPTIYTRTEKIQLWKLGPLRNQSTLMAIGEIAAMAFAKELMQITYSPYVYDAIMLYPHNKEQAQVLVNEILTYKKDKE